MSSRQEELEGLCLRLLADGQQVTTRIEQLLQGHTEGEQFDRQLERLHREQDEIHSKLELTMQQLKALGA